MIQLSTSSFANEVELLETTTPRLKKSPDPEFTTQRNPQRSLIDITNQNLTEAHQYSINERKAREQKALTRKKIIAY
jgi:hypothetical protein